MDDIIKDMKTLETPEQPLPKLDTSYNIWYNYSLIMDLPPAPRPITYYGHGLWEIKIRGGFLGRKLIHAEVLPKYTLSPGFVEKVISRDDLNNIPELVKCFAAALRYCKTGHKNRGFAKVLGYI